MASKCAPAMLRALQRSKTRVRDAASGCAGAVLVQVPTCTMAAREAHEGSTTARAADADETSDGKGMGDRTAAAARGSGSRVDSVLLAVFSGADDCRQSARQVRCAGKSRSYFTHIAALSLHHRCTITAPSLQYYCNTNPNICCRYVQPPRFKNVGGATTPRKRTFNGSGLRLSSR
jgi:hypothetical protein